MSNLKCKICQSNEANCSNIQIHILIGKKSLLTSGAFRQCIVLAKVCFSTGHLFLTSHSTLCRLYGARCSACQTVFTKNDFVMRAKTKMFHLECFRCAACRRHLGKSPLLSTGWSTLFKRNINFKRDSI
jgi:hypothetical protein